MKEKESIYVSILKDIVNSLLTLGLFLSILIGACILFFLPIILAKEFDNEWYYMIYPIECYLLILVVKIKDTLESRKTNNMF